MITEDLPRPAWTLTLSEFLGPGRVNPKLEVAHDGFCSVGASAIDMPSRQRLQEMTDGIMDDVDYSIARLKNGLDVVLLFDDGTGDLEVVGQYLNDSLNLVHAHRGRKLSVPLILAAAEARGDGAPNLGDYTPAGYAAHRAAHRAVVSWALEMGYEVPEAVRADYRAAGASPGGR